MEKDAVFLTGKANAFVDRARRSGLNLSTIAKDRLENVNRLYGLRTASRVEEGKANRPPEQKRIEVEKLLSGGQQLDESSKPRPASLGSASVSRTGGRIEARGRDFYRAVCERDLEGIVAKWKAAPYRPDVAPSSWIKIKNPQYSQARDRAELFER